jgi:hypothetical protein
MVVRRIEVEENGKKYRNRVKEALVPQVTCPPSFTNIISTDNTTFFKEVLRHGLGAGVSSLNAFFLESFFFVFVPLEDFSSE